MAARPGATTAVLELDDGGVLGLHVEQAELAVAAAFIWGLLKL